MSGAASRAQVLLVEDDAALRELIVTELDDRGYRVRSVADCASAQQALAETAPDLVLSDLRLPDGTGMDVLALAQRHAARPAVILITAFGTVPQAVDALKAGADDFLTKPVDLEHLAVRISRALERRRTGLLLHRLRSELRESGRAQIFHGMVARSATMARLFAAIHQVARVDEPVLISGESGTGKELVARAIHAEGPRSAGPFVAVNCASVPEHLLEAEFFGHTANAFTGAGARRAGLFAEADGGTLFLDEIGEMSDALQAKLLRVLEDRRVRPLGASTEQQVDVRIIAATHRDLEVAVQAGRWREDLYYRLEALTLCVPALRERGDEDRLAITQHILVSLAAERGLDSLRIAPDAFEALQRYPFPGNVRELGNALARAATFCDGRVIRLRDLPDRMRRGDTPASDSGAFTVSGQTAPTLASLEQRYIRWVLARTGQNKKRAAEILGVGRRTLYRKLSVDDGAAG